ncbi:hypothetical protein [Methanoculleus chikugoensis]|uniref:Uncharacterized protein n=1 Tax=Methanoculleus chikugoensis TaxID=118126 RepID=A0ABN5XQB9_9EURY|nr:hypothetical protein [Methanoculleus chikugoensis]BBL69249.1 hypothetical protein MchiMG62_24300 [Methanoculleus chikugoensis]
MEKMDQAVQFLSFKVQTENGVPIKPISPFSRDPRTIVHREFIDYQSREVKRGSHYFKPLSQIILEYANHPESKFAGKIDLLERRTLWSLISFTSGRR